MPFLVVMKSALSLIHILPAPANELEARYTELVEALDERRASLAFQADRRATEMQRYYTLWAHQIKTPLAAMRLMISSADPAAFGPLEDQLFSVERYVELVLQYQRLESISGDLDFVRCSLDDLARQDVYKRQVQLLQDAAVAALRPGQLEQRVPVVPVSYTHLTPVCFSPPALKAGPRPL